MVKTVTKKINSPLICHSHSRGYERRRRADAKGQDAGHSVAGKREALPLSEENLPGPHWVRGIGDKETDGYLGGEWCMWGGLASSRVKPTRFVNMDQFSSHECPGRKVFWGRMGVS